MTAPVVADRSLTERLAALQAELPTVVDVDTTVSTSSVRSVSPVPLTPLTPPAPRTLSGTVTPRQVDHGRWQTPYTYTQGDRGVCWAFAGRSALEAAYARAGVTVELSEHYLVHACRAWGNSLEDATGGVTSSLVGFQGSPDVVSHLSRFRIPTRRYAPYLRNESLAKIAASIPQTRGGLPTDQAPVSALERIDWFEFDQRVVQTAARWEASWGVAEFGSADGTVDNVRRALAAGHDVVAPVLQRGHVVLIYGYDDAAGEFLIKNSWSAPGFERMKYQNDPRLDSVAGQVYYITRVRPVARELHAAWLGRWAIDHDGWRGRLVLRTYVDLRGGAPLGGSPKSPLRLGRWYGEDGTSKAVTGWFEEDGRILRCTVGDQKFELCLHTGDLDRASGRTWWNGQEFGVVASRFTATGGATGAAFSRLETIGLWETDHDGHEGVFDVGPTPSYREAETGSTRAVRYDGGTGQRVDAHVAFGPSNGDQRFELLVHTRERGRLGGVTQWAGHDFGVQGRLSEALYIVREDGRLDWAQHTGRASLAFDWKVVEGVGSGWDAPARVVGGRDGIVYTVGADGDLSWYAHVGHATGKPEWVGPRKVGVGWGDLVQLFAGAPGVLYGITREGGLTWFKHLGRRDGTFTWEGPFDVTPVNLVQQLTEPIDWTTFRAVTADPDGAIYAIRSDGALLWFRHRGADHGFRIWQGPRVVGVGWQDVDRLVATGSGYLYGRFAAGTARAGQLWLWRHAGHRTGEFAWRDGAQVGTGWGDDDVRAFVAS